MLEIGIVDIVEKNVCGFVTEFLPSRVCFITSQRNLDELVSYIHENFNIFTIALVLSNE